MNAPRTSKDQLRVEKLPNGLYRVFDFACQWHACFSFHADRACQNIQWEHGGTDALAYRFAVAKFIGQKDCGIGAL